jgi:hypothetical protein
VLHLSGGAYGATAAQLPLLAGVSDNRAVGHFRYEVVVEAISDAGAVKAISRARGWDSKQTRGVVGRLPASLGFFTREIAERIRAEVASAGAVVSVYAEGDKPNDLAPLAGLGRLYVFPNRLVVPEGQSYALTDRTKATTESAGSITAGVTRGRNMAAKAAGGLLVPGGIFLFGNARERVHEFDNRELYIVAEDPDWFYTVAVHPNLRPQAMHFVAALHRAVAALGPSPSAKPTRDDMLTKLERLADLRDRGALTEAEFEDQKHRMLESAQD